jgi:hypothetical protein
MLGQVRLAWWGWWSSVVLALVGVRERGREAGRQIGKVGGCGRGSIGKGWLDCTCIRIICPLRIMQPQPASLEKCVPSMYSKPVRYVNQKRECASHMYRASVCSLESPLSTSTAYFSPRRTIGWSASVGSGASAVVRHASLYEASRSQATPRLDDR